MLYAKTERGKATAKRWQNKRRELLSKLKDKPCADCGLKYPTWVMEFDHVTGIKSDGVGNLFARGKSLARILAEIAKCEVVCANCHRERTYLRQLDAIQ